MEDFPRDILHGWFVMIDQMWINRLFSQSDILFFYSGSDSSTCFTDINRVAVQAFNFVYTVFC